MKHAIPPTLDNILAALGYGAVGAAPFVLRAGDTMLGDLKFTDASFDIGKSGATRPRDGFFSRNLVVGNNITSTAGGFILGSNVGVFNNSGSTTAFRNVANNADTSISAAAGIFSSTIRGINSTIMDMTTDGVTTFRNSAANTGYALAFPSDGVVTITNFARTDFTRLQIGGTSSAFPSFKRVAAAVEAWLADNSARTKFAASVTVVDVVTVAALPAAASNAGAVSQVSDASTTLVLGLGGIVAGGGANFAPVWCDGTNWRYG